MVCTLMSSSLLLSDTASNNEHIRDNIPLPTEPVYDTQAAI